MSRDLKLFSDGELRELWTFTRCKGAEDRHTAFWRKRLELRRSNQTLGLLSKRRQWLAA
jgi:hypothetical protein